MTGYITLGQDRLPKVTCDCEPTIWKRKGILKLVQN